MRFLPVFLVSMLSISGAHAVETDIHENDVVVVTQEMNLDCGADCSYLFQEGKLLAIPRSLEELFQIIDPEKSSCFANGRANLKVGQKLKISWFEDSNVPQISFENSDGLEIKLICDRDREIECCTKEDPLTRAKLRKIMGTAFLFVTDKDAQDLIKQLIAKHEAYKTPEADAAIARLKSALK